MDEDENKIIITRSGRHAKQISYLYQNRVPRKKRKIENVEQNNALNVINIDQERLELANARERFRLMREEMDRNMVELRNQQQALQQQALQQQAQWQILQQQQAAQLQQPLGNVQRAPHQGDAVLSVADVGVIRNRIS